MLLEMPAEQRVNAGVDGSPAACTHAGSCQNGTGALTPDSYVRVAGTCYTPAGASESASTVLWRGMRNRVVPEAFHANGATELAPMSTSIELEVAAQYSASTVCLILLLRVDTALSRGADLTWLSAFPREAESLYPPLTYLKPTGRKQSISLRNGGFNVVEVEPRLP